MDAWRPVAARRALPSRGRGGKLRLVKNAASTPTLLVLDLVAEVALTGYSVGFNLPADSTRLKLAATNGFTPGTALPAGTSPIAAAAMLPSAGPMKVAPRFVSISIFSCVAG